MAFIKAFLKLLCLNAEYTYSVSSWVGRKEIVYWHLGFWIKAMFHISVFKILMVFDKVIKYNSCILHSWIKSFKSGTPHYCIFIARFLEASREPQVWDASGGSVKLLAGAPVHSSSCSMRISDILHKGHFLPYVTILLPQGRAGIRSRPRPWAHLFSGLCLAFWRLMSDPAGPAHPTVCIQPPKPMVATNRCLALASSHHVHGARPLF